MANHVKKKTRVLAVDDEPSILELLKTALNALGTYDVTTASSVDDAIQTLERQEKPFDCLLLDIQMPDVNGITFCAELRKITEYRKTPIIMLTAMSDRDYIDRAFAAGATDYLTKPFDLLELRSRLGTASMLIEEQGRAKSSIEVAKALKDELETNLHFNLEDPIAIDDVDNVLGYAEFENYVIQLSQGKLFNSFATAVKIANAEALYAKLSSSAFRAVLHDVAAAISRLVRKDGYMVCYRGNGVFLSISHRRNGPLHPGAELHLNQIAATIMSRHAERQDVKLIVGEAASMRAITKYGSLYALNKAVDNVENRVVSETDVMSLPSHVVMHRSRSTAHAHLERRAYETVLDDLLRDEPRLRSNGT
ncbi:response regulator [Aestuariivita boseongensis]|uniref:response regulator n=1 Tax=Aestuariivita boseongensis TaxID=1470562 RepID=UPI0006825480|nr:response regulator [Aestuariivita boseongensis]